MFWKSFCVVLVLCGCVNSAEYIRGASVKNFSSDIQIKHHKFSKAKHDKIIPVFKTGDARTKVVRKRGIVIVDSDFDIPSEIYTHENNLNAIDVIEKNEGSGTSESNEVTKDAEDDITHMSELQKVTNASTSSTQTTTKTTKSTTVKTDTATSTNPEGSGDDGPLITEEQFISTKGISTERHTTPEYDIQERIPDICINTSCDTTDLYLFTSEERTNVAEGTNLTLTCKSNNHSLHTMLHWYKSNGSEYFLQTLGTNAQLHLNIPNTALIHSGMYVCVKREGKDSCCNINSNLIIYRVPSYRYHLIIIGLIALAGIILCIFLSVRQSVVLKKYTKEFTEKHGKMKNLL